MTMRMVRVFACFLVIGLTGAQAQTLSHEQVQANLVAVTGDPAFIEMTLDEMNLPPNVRPHVATHLAEIWANRHFLDHMAGEITRNQSILTGADGALSSDLTREFSALLTESLFGAGLHLLPTSDIRDFLLLSSDMLRRMDGMDCAAVVSGRLSATQTQTLEMQALGGLSDERIAHYFRLLRAGVIAAVERPSGVSRLSQSQEEFAERALHAAIEAAISKREDGAQLEQALMNMDGADTAHHCEVTILIIDETAHMQGAVGDWLVHWFAFGMTN